MKIFEVYSACHLHEQKVYFNVFVTAAISLLASGKTKET